MIIDLLNAPSLAPFFRVLGFVVFFPCGFELLGFTRRIVLAALGGALVVGCGAPLPQRFEVGGVVAELLFGMMLAVPLGCLVGGAAAVGELLDAVRGESLGSVYDPSFGSFSTLAALARNATWGWLVTAEILLDSIELIVSSTAHVPLGEVGVGLAFGGDGFRVAAAMVGELCRLAVPWVIVALLVDVAGGLVSRLIPQLSLSGEVFLTKTVLGLLVLLSVDRGAVGAHLVGLVHHGGVIIERGGGAPGGVFPRFHGG